jgi:hypothetical protein
VVRVAGASFRAAVTGAGDVAGHPASFVQVSGQLLSTGKWPAAGKGYGKMNKAGLATPRARRPLKRQFAVLKVGSL